MDGYRGVYITNILEGYRGVEKASPMKVYRVVHVAGGLWRRLYTHTKRKEKRGFSIQTYGGV
jgi:hypothetical protein